MLQDSGHQREMMVNIFRFCAAGMGTMEEIGNNGMFVVFSNVGAPRSVAISGMFLVGQGMNKMISMKFLVLHSSGLHML